MGPRSAPPELPGRVSYANPFGPRSTPPERPGGGPSLATNDTSEQSPARDVPRPSRKPSLRAAWAQRQRSKVIGAVIDVDAAAADGSLDDNGETFDTHLDAHTDFGASEMQLTAISQASVSQIAVDPQFSIVDFEYFLIDFFTSSERISQ